MPVNLVRPHASRVAITARSQPVENASASIEDKRAEEVLPDQALVCKLWEEYWLLEAFDTQLDEAFNTLVSVTCSLPPTTHHVHGISNRNGVIKLSDAAVRDSAILFNLGKATAAARAIPNYLGLIIASGCRFISSQPTVLRNHVFWWIGDPTTATLHQATVDGGKQIDFIHGLEVKLKDMSKLHAIVLLEGSPTHGPPLHELLKLPEPEEVSTVNPARVRIQTPSLQPQPVVKTEFEPPTSVIDDLGTAVVASEPDTEIPLDENFEYATPDNGETWYCNLGSSESGDTAWYLISAFPVDRATRPATKEELREKYSEFTAARKKEL